MVKYIFWKLQTRANQRELDPKTEEFERFKSKYGKIYNKENGRITLRTDIEICDMYKNMAYKNPLFSSIYSLTLAYVNEGEIRIKYFTGEEKSLINTFLNTLNDNHFSGATLVQYESGVLLPYLGIRMGLNNTETALPIGLQYLNMRPWDLKSIDLRHYFNGAGDYNFNLRDMAYVYGLSTEDIVDYTDENTAFLSNQFDELKQSAINEIKLCVNVFNKLNKETIIEDVKVTEQEVENVQIEKKVSVLEELYNSNILSSKIKTEIRRLCEKKRLTKKDKENLFVILRGVWVKTDFVNGQQDGKKVVAEKEQEIKDFIDTI